MFGQVNYSMTDDRSDWTVGWLVVWLSSEMSLTVAPCRGLMILVMANCDKTIFNGPKWSIFQRTAGYSWHYIINNCIKKTHIASSYLLWNIYFLWFTVVSPAPRRGALLCTWYTPFCKTIYPLVQDSKCLETNKCNSLFNPLVQFQPQL